MVQFFCLTVYKYRLMLHATFFVQVVLKVVAGLQT